MSVHRSSTMALSALALLASCILRSMSVRASDGPGNTRMTTGVSVGMPVLLGVCDGAGHLTSRRSRSPGLSMAQG